MMVFVIGEKVSHLGEHQKMCLSEQELWPVSPYVQQSPKDYGHNV